MSDFTMEFNMLLAIDELDVYSDTDYSLAPAEELCYYDCSGVIAI